MPIKQEESLQLFPLGNESFHLLNLLCLTQVLQIYIDYIN